jgi:integrase
LYRPLAEVLLGAGLRISEALALEWRHIERAYKRGVIGNAQRRPWPLRRDRLPRPRCPARSPPGRAIGRPPSTLAFASTAGTYCTPANVRECGHRQALADARLPEGVRLHDLGHTAATMWLVASACVYFVQQQLGHADLKTTIGTYGHPDQARTATRPSAPRRGGEPARASSTDAFSSGSPVGAQRT